MLQNHHDADREILSLRAALAWDPIHDVRVRYRFTEHETGVPIGRFHTMYFESLDAARTWIKNLDVLGGLSRRRIALAGVIHQWKSQPRLAETFILC